MRIQNNLMGVNTHRQLNLVQGNQKKATEKLSSGFRINRAGDDAAGLAISEKMRAQIRGLNQASRNAQNGISLLQTVEGAMGETHAILQRMRELSVQAATDTNVEIDREQLGKEINQLKSEVNRIANTTEFNTQKILNYGAALQADAFEGISANAVNTLSEKIPGWINDSMTLLKDNFGIDHPDSPTNRPMSVVYVNDDSAGYAASMSSNSSVAELTLTINLAKVTDSSGELIDEQSLDGLLAHEIMHAYQYTEMSALIQDGTMSAEETWLMEGLSMAIQGGNSWISAITGGITNADISGTFDNSSTDYASAFIAIKTLHEITDGGINAIIDRLETGDTLDQAIQNTIQQNQGEVTSSGTYDHSNYGGGETGYHSWTEFAADFNGGDFDNYLNSSADFTAGTGAIIDGATAGSSGNLNLADTIPNGTGTALVYTHYDLSFATDGASTSESATPEFILFQIGANEGQNLQFNTFDLTSNGLGLDSVNVATQSSADIAITIIDDAITTVSTKRSEVGAIQNRLEHSIKSLDNASENLQAAESRIRDIDMAKGMLEFTKSNILSQAAQAMLAQANAAPQSVLQLLR